MLRLWWINTQSSSRMESFIWNVFIGSTGWNTFTTSPTVTLICQYEYLLKGGSQSALEGTERSKLGRVSWVVNVWFPDIQTTQRKVLGGQCLYFRRRFYFLIKEWRGYWRQNVGQSSYSAEELRKWNEVFQHHMTHEFFYNASIMARRKRSVDFKMRAARDDKLTNQKPTTTKNRRVR